MALFDGGRVRVNPEILAELKDLGTAVNIAVHGVSLSIASHEGWSDTYLHLLDELIDQIDVVWHSEHLGYTKVDGRQLGIMLALPKTEEMMDLLCERAASIRARYGLPFLLENIVHVVPDAPGEYSDAGFLNTLAERTGCGVILDTYNLECDAHNQKFDIKAFLDELRPSIVAELHVAGGVEHNGFLLDVHSQRCRPSTVELARGFSTKPGGAVRAVVYEFMPEAIENLGREAIESELKQLRSAFAG